MSTPNECRDLLPDTATARALRRAVAVDAAKEPKPRPARREIEIDPDAPNAPTCGPRKYIVVDPDAPDAPTCKPKRYIVAPEPESIDRMAMAAEARELGRRLAEQFGERP
jgi:hypothetical protein